MKTLSVLLLDAFAFLISNSSARVETTQNQMLTIMLWVSRRPPAHHFGVRTTTAHQYCTALVRWRLGNPGHGL